MRYVRVKDISIENGPGVRVSLFVAGCRNHCKGCFQPETWDFKAGWEWNQEHEEELMKFLEPSFVDGLSILGGDPFEPENLPEVTKLARLFRVRYPNKSLWVYTGYYYEDFKDHEIMNYIDVLVDGPFVEEKKNLALRFRGSENQRLIDIPKTRAAGKIVAWRNWEDGFWD